MKARASRLVRGRGASGVPRVEIELNLEQAPDLENRVVLGRERDALGQPRAEVRWRWGAMDRASHERLRRRLATEIERRGVGRLEIRPGVALDPGAHHPMGTTRMSGDPALGVVDPDARMHGLSNLFVAGSSVFPTSGFANPTLTVVALALRLAAHLQSRFGGTPAESRASMVPGLPVP
jgi:choline dehydrogenase-like flavoprotein